METRNAHEIMDAVKAGEPYTFPGVATGRPFVMSWTGAHYICKAETGQKGVRKLKPMPMGLVKATQIIENFLNSQK